MQLPLNGFHIGDVVLLKSHRHIRMTINKVDKENVMVECVWFDQYDRLHTGEFHVHLLEKVQ